MRTENRSTTSILPAVIVVGILAFTAGCGGDNAGIVAAPPQMKALLLSCQQEGNRRYTLALLDSLGGPRSTANAINNLGQVVGAARTPDGFADINDRGQIVASALLQDGSTRAVVLTPTGCN